MVKLEMFDGKMENSLDQMVGVSYAVRSVCVRV